MALAQRREIDAVLVTELSRWGRSTLDLLHTLKELETWRVSVIAMNGLAFDLSTPHGRMMATIIAGIAEFERELIQERIRSGIAAAKARGKRWGASRGSGRNPIVSPPKSSRSSLLGAAIASSAANWAKQKYRRRNRQARPNRFSRIDTCLFLIRSCLPCYPARSMA